MNQSGRLLGEDMVLVRGRTWSSRQELTGLRGKKNSSSGRWGKELQEVELRREGVRRHFLVHTIPGSSIDYQHSTSCSLKEHVRNTQNLLIVLTHSGFSIDFFFKC